MQRGTQAIRRFYTFKSRRVSPLLELPHEQSHVVFGVFDKEDSQGRAQWPNSVTMRPEESPNGSQLGRATALTLFQITRFPLEMTTTSDERSYRSNCHRLNIQSEA